VTLLIATLAVCAVSALVPLVNAEAYVGAIAVANPHVSTWWLAAIAAAGQACGKVVFYFIGAQSLNWAWVRRKTASPKAQARLELWQRRTNDNPWATTGLIGVSSVFGLPPLAIVSVLAGQLRTSLGLFVAAVFVGRTVRFAAIIAGVSAIGLS
jgi:membrane protein YqaA with SNARE-associated domain